MDFFGSKKFGRTVLELVKSTSEFSVLIKQREFSFLCLSMMNKERGKHKLPWALLVSLFLRHGYVPGHWTFFAFS